MKNVVIVGCGGLAKEISLYLSEISDISIKGILADDINKYEKSSLEIRYLGKIYEYNIEPNDYFIIAFGAHPGKYQIYNYLSKKGAKFYTFIHPNSIIFPNVVIGDGVIVMPFCVIGDSVVLESNVFINKFVNVGHDSLIKQSSILSPYTMVGGGCEVGSNSYFASGSILAPNLKIGENCVISANTFVRKNLKSNTFTFNSAKNIIKEL
ncbi:acetyltransferase [Campylobacter hyointestinalis subsp. hyointestinalis]|uniref:acetyltransferase n=1 Tax=Campylobacter hyointestinalis TaxID=198 RepID=UPI000724B48D|nr:acetyltransferase [Campylobacter hyointestinalis]PPB58018.1 hypothetical protein CDQ71_03615 [Campylobacter hyointestinalis subsp. hyointestinalis]QCT99144.1 acetyltransferase [Campylobacter hyointestinalis subsp. hyointestinalis]CUU76467.1 UDP-3-O-[3-hydroxymyristoyl] glucosamine N-acyltransferase [Campylobacter hyointestinalis subsp. hyointestinalis]